MHQVLIRFFLTCMVIAVMISPASAYVSRAGPLIEQRRGASARSRSRAVGPRPTRHWTSRRLGSPAPQGGCPHPRPAILGRVGQVCPPTARDAHQRRQVRGTAERLYGTGSSPWRPSGRSPDRRPWLRPQYTITARAPRQNPPRGCGNTAHYGPMRCPPVGMGTDSRPPTLLEPY